ncbi:TetR/AcrR family transcriptional regulator [Streptomyces sp. TG1A-60]|uniref:TetR/AcrR family transcriptional regulator n=1 Tax=Streptomyces sp. TG1A-60 TaxID=3129111 RepID=UPI0030D4F2B8
MPQNLKDHSTANRVLDAAQVLVKARGWSAVSYADLAERVGIRTASIHHHFPGKAELGRALVTRYNSTFQSELADIDKRSDGPVQRLRGYLTLLRAALADGGSLCLCTMLAADYEMLPAPMKDLVTKFNDINVEWLAGVLRDGAAAGRFVSVDDPITEAQVIFSEAQGAQLLARCYRDAARYDLVTDSLVARLTAPR